MGTHWLCHWTQLEQCEENKLGIIHVCRRLEVAALKFYASFEWTFNVRIES